MYEKNELSLVMSGMSSVYTLTALSTQRWLLVTRHGKFPLNNRTVTVTILALVWSLSLAIALPPFFGWAFYAPETSGLRYVYFPVPGEKKARSKTIIAFWPK